jgi:hypothetical protein
MTSSVDPELRKRVERIKSSPVQMYREAGDYSNRELVEGILVSPDDIAAIEAVARAEAGDVDDAWREAEAALPNGFGWGIGIHPQNGGVRGRRWSAAWSSPTTTSGGSGEADTTAADEGLADATEYRVCRPPDRLGKPV